MTNQSGMSLLELLITSTISGFVLLSASHLLVSSIKGAKNVEFHSGFSSTVQSMQLLMNRRDLCSQALRSTAQPSVNAWWTPDAKTIPLDKRPTALYLGNQQILSQGQTTPQGTYSFNLVELDPALRFVTPTRTTYVVRLTLTQNKLLAGYGSQNLDQEFLMNLETNTDPTAGEAKNQITACWSGPQSFPIPSPSPSAHLLLEKSSRSCDVFYTESKDGLVLVRLATAGTVGRIRAVAYVDGVITAYGTAQDYHPVATETEVDSTSFQFSVRAGQQWRVEKQNSWADPKNPGTRICEIDFSAFNY